MDASSKFQNTLPTTPTILLQKLDDLGIIFDKFDHPPLFTVNDAKLHQKNMIGVHVKNLFLRDKKKNNFLIVTEQDTIINLKTIPSKIGSDRLSFGSQERLWRYLGVRPGAVSPLALINDFTRSVTLIFQDILQTEEKIHFHPLVNDISVAVKLNDLSCFFEFTGHKPMFVNL